VYLTEVLHITLEDNLISNIFTIDMNMNIVFLLVGYTGDYCDVNINDCEGISCVHGTCIDRVGYHECRCDQGYAGSRCETEIDECASSPCKHGGTCTDFVGFYECRCLTGTSGLNCEFDYNDCNSNPCVNGQCHDLISGYNCSCKPG